METFFVDHNIAGRAIAHTGATTAQDWATCYAQGHLEIAVMRQLAASGAELVTSVPALHTLQLMLNDPTVTDFDRLEYAESVAAAAAFSLFVRTTGGTVVSEDAVAAQLNRASRIVPAHLQGRGRGQIDHEDMTVLAGLFAFLAETDPTYELDARVVLVTNDRGMLNCAAALAPHNIAVVDAKRFARVAIAA
jgi:hypothetical protein